ncbi:MAG: hypothetical protein RL885_05980 [Planctomycetota bacterium]
MKLSVWAVLILSLGFLWGGNTQEPSASEESDESRAISQELAEIYAADQADRESLDFDDPKTIQKMMQGDQKRLARVEEIVSAGKLSTGENYYHAAMVLQHGRGEEHYLLSHVLATAAAFQGHEPGRWLAAASLDRYLNQIGKPQIFGTQYHKLGDAWSQEPYETSMADAIRRAYGVPTLEEGRARLEELRDR